MAELGDYLLRRAHLPATEVAWLRSLGERRALRKGAAFCSIGQSEHELAFVQSGILQVFAPSPDGRHVVLGFAVLLVLIWAGRIRLLYAAPLMALLFAGSGERFATTFGGDVRRQGLNASNRLRPDGTIVPRNDFVGEPLHRVDLRLQQRIRLGARTSVDGLVEVFNVFNQSVYDERNYENNPSNPLFGTIDKSVIRQSNFPRYGQLGIKLLF